MNCKRCVNLRGKQALPGAVILKKTRRVHLCSPVEEWSYLPGMNHG